MPVQTKRKKNKPPWSDVKAKLGGFDKAGLMQLVSDLDDYKKRVALALAPDVYRKHNAEVSVATAKKAISEYNKAAGDPLGILELRLFWCETAVKFSMDFGYADQGYFDCLAIQYQEACRSLPVLDEPLLSNTIERLENLRDDAQMGHGVGDFMGDVLSEALLDLPCSQVEAVVPQLKET